MNTYFGTIAIVKNLVLRKKAVSLDMIIIERNERDQVLIDMSKGLARVYHKES